MTYAAFLKLLEKRLQRIREYAASPVALCRNRKKLHGFRVELKRWRTNLSLLKAADPCFPYPEVYAPFKTVFRLAGAVRSWQLQALLLEHTENRPRLFSGFYEDYIWKQKQQAGKTFREILRKVSLPQWEDLREAFRLSGKMCTKSVVQKYFLALKAKILKIVQMPSQQRDLHLLRKVLKEYKINRLAAVKYWNFDPGKPTGVPQDSARFADQLGDWHDLEVAVVQLHSDLITHNWSTVIHKSGLRLEHLWKIQEQESLALVEAQLKQLP